MDHEDTPANLPCSASWYDSATIAELEGEIAASTDPEVRRRLTSMQNSRSLLLHLPAELLEIIFDEIYEAAKPYYRNIEGLRVCALVCRELLPFARRRLFAQISLFSPEACRTAFLFLKNNHALRHCVRGLRTQLGLELKDDYLHWFVLDEPLFELLRDVQGLALLESHYFLRNLMKDPPALDMFARITRLELVHAGFRDVSAMHDFFKGCSMLHSLNIEYLHAEDESDLLRRPLPCLRLHALDTRREEDWRITTWLLWANLPGFLTDFLCCMTFVQHNTIQMMSPVLQSACGGLISVFILQGDDFRGEHLAAVLSRTCPLLRHVNIIRGSRAQDYSAPLLPTIRAFSNGRLRSFYIDIPSLRSLQAIVDMCYMIVRTPTLQRLEHIGLSLDDSTSRVPDDLRSRATQRLRPTIQWTEDWSFESHLHFERIEEYDITSLIRVTPETRAPSVYCRLYITAKSSQAFVGERLQGLAILLR